VKRACLLLAIACASHAAVNPPLSDAQFHLASLRLTQRIEQVRREMGALSISVAFHDHETGRRFRHAADEKYLAASMVKLPIAVAVMDAIHHGRFRLDSPVRMFNAFRSMVSGETYRISRGSELDPSVHDRIGGTMPLADLTDAMIARSSNVGTNILLETLGLSSAKKSWEKLAIPGIEFRRGLGDQWAADAGIQNTVTAEGFEQLLTAIAHDRVVSPEASEWLRASLFRQQIRSGIPHGIPPYARRRTRVAHKTGNISTVEHDGGLVYVEDRKPYALVILSRWPGRGSGHAHALARIAYSIHEWLIAGR
jgi:beta-lactamase class A